MNKRLLITGLVGGAFLSVASTSIMAQPANEAPTPPAGEKAVMMKQDFPGAENLTTEQKAYIKKALQDLRDTLRPQISMMQGKEAMLRAQLMQKKVDKTQVNSLVSEINDLRSKILREVVDTSLQIKDKTGVSIYPKMMIGMGGGPKMHKHKEMFMMGPGPGPGQ